VFLFHVAWGELLRVKVPVLVVMLVLVILSSSEAIFCAIRGDSDVTFSTIGVDWFHALKFAAVAPALSLSIVEVSLLLLLVMSDAEKENSGSPSGQPLHDIRAIHWVYASVLLSYGSVIM
jgi:hypothetical protein